MVYDFYIDWLQMNAASVVTVRRVQQRYAALCAAREVASSTYNPVCLSCIKWRRTEYVLQSYVALCAVREVASSTYNPVRTVSELYKIETDIPYFSVCEWKKFIQTAETVVYIFPLFFLFFWLCSRKQPV